MADCELLEVLQHRKLTRASEIDDNIWLGSGSDAENLNQLIARNIHCVLNVSDDVPNFHDKVVGIVYLKLDVRDFGQDHGISRKFEDAFEFLKFHVVERNERVLVHCAAGANRYKKVVRFITKCG